MIPKDIGHFSVRVGPSIYDETLVGGSSDLESSYVSQSCITNIHPDGKLAFGKLCFEFAVNKVANLTPRVVDGVKGSDVAAYRSEYDRR